MPELRLQPDDIPRSDVSLQQRTRPAGPLAAGGTHVTPQETRQSPSHDMTGQENKPAGPKYFLDLEGVDYPWYEPSITVPQVRELAGWTTDQQVMIVNLNTNEETVLAEDAAIELKPGHGFGRKFKFRRGAE
jgi:hypothetical protein